MIKHHEKNKGSIIDCISFYFFAVHQSGKSEQKLKQEPGGKWQCSVHGGGLNGFILMVCSSFSLTVSTTISPGMAPQVSSVFHKTRKHTTYVTPGYSGEGIFSVQSGLITFWIDTKLASTPSNLCSTQKLKKRCDGLTHLHMYLSAIF